MAGKKNKNKKAASTTPDELSISEKVKKGKENKKAKDKSKEKKNGQVKGFFSNFKDTAIDDFKGTAVVLLIYGVVCLIMHSLHPLSIVVSGSMEPVMYRGDMIIADGWKDTYKEGDIVMWRFKKRSPIIVHRIFKVLETGNYITKGDNNPVNDTSLYEKYGHRNPSAGISGAEHIISEVYLHIPKIGYPIMLAKENPIPTLIISIAWDFAWTKLRHKRWPKPGELVYNIISTISILMLAQQLSV